MFETFLSILRNKQSTIAEFRTAADALANLLAEKAIEHMATQKISISTPFEKTTGEKISYDIMFVPILRSGIAMLPAFLKIFPYAHVGIIGLKRDETSPTKEAHLYYINFPKITSNTFVIILDPTIATGGTGLKTLQQIIKAGVPEKNILYVAMLAAKPGLEAIKKSFPDIHLITCAVDPELNAQKFILPGFGDFGDRYFGTE